MDEIGAADDLVAVDVIVVNMIAFVVALLM